MKCCMGVTPSRCGEVQSDLRGKVAMVKAGGGSVPHGARALAEHGAVVLVLDFDEDLV